MTELVKFKLNRNIHSGASSLPTTPITFFKKNNNKLYDPFLWIKATEEAVRGGSLLFTTKFPDIPNTYLIDIRRMKG